MTLTDLQHFKYAGGGYFRDARIPKGKTAPVLHGSEIIQVIQDHLNPPLGIGHHSLPGNDETTCHCDDCTELCK